MRINRGRTLAALALLLPLAVVIALYFAIPRRPRHEPEAVAPPKPEAPPDLEKLRGAFDAGLDALAHKNGGEAVKHFASFTFRGRAVEEYRLWLLAQGHQLAKEKPQARATLARLWARDPRGVYRDEAGATLAALYGDAGDYRHAYDTAIAAAQSAASSESAAAARMGAMQAALADGDVSAVLYAARSVAIKNP